MAKITGLYKVVWCFCNQVSFSHYSSCQHPLHLGMGCGCWLALNVKGDSLSLWPVSVSLSQLPLPCSDVSLQQAAGQWQLTSWLPLLCGSAQWFSAAPKVAPLQQTGIPTSPCKSVRLCPHLTLPLGLILYNVIHWCFVAETQMHQCTHMCWHKHPHSLCVNIDM